MAPPKFEKAIKVMTEHFRFSEETVRPILQNLRSCKRTWKDIECDNYSLLVNDIIEQERKEEEKELQNLSEDEPEVYELFVRSNVKGQTSQFSARSDSSLIVYEDKDFISHLSSSPEAKFPVPFAMMLQEENGSSGTNYFEPMNVDDEYEAVFGSPCEQGVIEGARLEDEPGCSNSEYIDEKNNELGNGSSSLSHLMIIRSEHLYIEDITRGMEGQKISLINEVNREELPTFNYTLKSIPYQNARVKFPLAQISLNDCCSSCTSDCLSSGTPCLCAKKSGGEFAYKTSGVVKDEFIDKCEQKLAFCEVCPLKRSKKTLTRKCKGHVIRKFIKECWFKCGCCKTCGNRTLQHGITAKLQVFMTPEGKGWGLRTLEDLPKGAFICEYVGEIITTMELVERNMKNMDMQHSYNVVLDADWRSSRGLKNEEALCLDGASYGNVARFINHRCHDANMIDIPVEVETPYRHCYHVAFFTTREVKAMEELNWDYGIDFSDDRQPHKLFQCRCGDKNCRGEKMVKTSDISSSELRQTVEEGFNPTRFSIAGRDLMARPGCGVVSAD